MRAEETEWVAPQCRKAPCHTIAILDQWLDRRPRYFTVYIRAIRPSILTQ